MIEVANTTTQALVTEYRYNGLGHRIGWHYDENVDLTVDGSDPWFYFAYNESWQQVATYRAADTSPKEQFVNHNAGLGGYGGSSAIDGAILRDRDVNTAWGTASDGTLEDRIYYCQICRGDVVEIMDDLDNLIEHVRHSSSCAPISLPEGDTEEQKVSVLEEESHTNIHIIICIFGSPAVKISTNSHALSINM